MSAYRPGQLYTGADGDLLFAIATAADIAFVTNHGTRVPLAKAEKVYAPLTLVRDVSDAPMKEIAAALVEVLDIPVPARSQDRHEHLSVLVGRTATLRGVMRDVAESGDSRSLISSIRWVAEQAPITYTPYTDEQAGDGS